MGGGPEAGYRGPMSWLIYVQVALLGAILLRQVLRPFTQKRRTTRAERMAARILRESRDLRQGSDASGRGN